MADAKKAEPQENTVPGTRTETVEIQPIAPEVPTDSEEEALSVITTGKGTFNQGIVPIGTEIRILGVQYSETWMRPKGKKDAEIAEAIMAERAEKKRALKAQALAARMTAAQTAV